MTHEMRSGTRQVHRHVGTLPAMMILTRPNLLSSILPLLLVIIFLLTTKRKRNENENETKQNETKPTTHHGFASHWRR